MSDVLTVHGSCETCKIMFSLTIRRFARADDPDPLAMVSCLKCFSVVPMRQRPPVPLPQHERPCQCEAMQDEDHSERCEECASWQVFQVDGTQAFVCDAHKNDENRRIVQ